MEGKGVSELVPLTEQVESALVWVAVALGWAVAQAPVEVVQVAVELEEAVPQMHGVVLVLAVAEQQPVEPPEEAAVQPEQQPAGVPVPVVQPEVVSLVQPLVRAPE